MQCLAFLFNNKCVLLQRTLILSEWCFFESNILLFCSQPCIIACIMDFVGVQILCQYTFKLLMSIFIGIIQNCSQYNQMLSNVVKTLNLFFLQYDVLFRTSSLPFGAYLVHFVRSFLCFATKPLALIITGLFDHVVQVFNCYQYNCFKVSGSYLTFKGVLARTTVFLLPKTMCFSYSIYLLLLVTFYKVYRSIWPSNAL